MHNRHSLANNGLADHCLPNNGLTDHCLTHTKSNDRCTHITCTDICTHILSNVRTRPVYRRRIYLELGLRTLFYVWPG